MEKLNSYWKQNHAKLPSFRHILRTKISQNSITSGFSTQVFQEIPKIHRRHDLFPKGREAKNSFCFLIAIKSRTFSNDRIGFLNDMRGSTLKVNLQNERFYKKLSNKFLFHLIKKNSIGKDLTDLTVQI